MFIVNSSINNTVHYMPLKRLGALYMHNHDDKYPTRPGVEPGTSTLQAPVDTNVPDGSFV